LESSEEALVSPLLVEIQRLEVLEAFRDRTLVKTHRNDEYRVFWLLCSDIQREAYFFLNVAIFVYGCLRQTYQHNVTRSHGPADFCIPILARNYILFIKPRGIPITMQALLKRVYGDPVVGGVAEKDSKLWPLGRGSPWWRCRAVHHRCL
jgi:hypothetical protein